jgi:hypothetical protein
MKTLLILAATAAITTAAAPAIAADKPAAGPPASLDPKIKFKDGDRYLGDLSSALEIPRESICKELGQYDCFRDAFRIVLGGVEAENLGVNVPLEEEALTAPIALDRVAMHVCVNRVKLDMDDPKHAILLRQMPKGGKPSKGWLKSTTANMYDRILNREPTASETAQVVAFYDKVATDGGKANPNAAKDWVTLSCFATASSTENIFY